MLCVVALLLVSLGARQAAPAARAADCTSCAEFLRGSEFDAAAVLDRDWRVFYMWTIAYEEPYQVRFRLPTPTLIDRFKAEVRNLSVAGPDGAAAALFMESTIDLSALFLGTPTPGRFRVITSLIFQYNVDQELYFAMKVVSPGYLAFMNCKVNTVVALAPLDKFPKEDEVEAAAAALRVRHLPGYPYSVRDPTLEHRPRARASDDDAADEEDIEVDKPTSTPH